VVPRAGSAAVNLLVVALLACAAVWLYLLLGRGGFWLCPVRDDGEFPDPPKWPSVAAIVPARDEAAVIKASIGSLAAQDYAGDFSILLVDDQSQDRTAALALGAAGRSQPARSVTVIRGRALPPGWTGKLYALQQGIEAAGSGVAEPAYVWLTDADIVYEPQALKSLVRRAEAGGLALTSLMVKLRCQSWAERALIPAFIFFFQMLYPFAWVGRQGSGVAAAAGGCMLVRREALAAAGGFAAIRDALIDDCALAARLKAVGPIWLGLTSRAVSIRPYDHFGDVRRMVARSAYAQLRYSGIALAGTVLAMLLVYVLPPLAALFAQGPAQWMGWAIWAIMAILFAPTLVFYRLSPLWGALLPIVALTYVTFTLDSAWQHVRGRGGMWKGRIQAARSP
jgi:hopene-associated glycosyltransferase HpnB